MKLCAQVAIINYLSEIWKKNCPVPSRPSGVIWPFESTTLKFDIIYPIFRVNKNLVRFILYLLSPCLMIYFWSLPALRPDYYWIPSDTVRILLQFTFGLKNPSFFRFSRVTLSPLLKHLVIRTLASLSIVSLAETSFINSNKLY